MFFFCRLVVSLVWSHAYIDAIVTLTQAEQRSSTDASRRASEWAIVERAVRHVTALADASPSASLNFQSTNAASSSSSASIPVEEQAASSPTQGDSVDPMAVESVLRLEEAVTRLSGVVTAQEIELARCRGTTRELTHTLGQTELALRTARFDLSEQTQTAQQRLQSVQETARVRESVWQDTVKQLRAAIPSFHSSLASSSEQSLATLVASAESDSTRTVPSMEAYVNLRKQLVDMTGRLTAGELAIKHSADVEQTLRAELSRRQGWVAALLANQSGGPGMAAIRVAWEQGHDAPNPSAFGSASVAEPVVSTSASSSGGVACATTTSVSMHRDAILLRLADRVDELQREVDKWHNVALHTGGVGLDGVSLGHPEAQAWLKRIVESKQNAVLALPTLPTNTSSTSGRTSTDKRNQAQGSGQNVVELERFLAQALLERDEWQWQHGRAVRALNEIRQEAAAGSERRVWLERELLLLQQTYPLERAQRESLHLDELAGCRRRITELSAQVDTWRERTTHAERAAAAAQEAHVLATGTVTELTASHTIARDAAAAQQRQHVRTKLCSSTFCI